MVASNPTHWLSQTGSSLTAWHAAVPWLCLCSSWMSTRCWTNKAITSPRPVRTSCSHGCCGDGYFSRISVSICGCSVETEQTDSSRKIPVIFILTLDLRPLRPACYLFTALSCTGRHQRVLTCRNTNVSVLQFVLKAKRFWVWAWVKSWDLLFSPGYCCCCWVGLSVRFWFCVKVKTRVSTCNIRISLCESFCILSN